MHLELAAIAIAVAIFWVHATPVAMWTRMHRIFPRFVYQGLKCTPCVAAWTYALTTLYHTVARSSTFVHPTFLGWVVCTIVVWSLAYIIMCLLD